MDSGMNFHRAKAESTCEIYDVNELFCEKRHSCVYFVPLSIDNDLTKCNTLSSPPIVLYSTF